MTPPKRTSAIMEQQQLAMLDMYGPLPLVPGVGSNIGVGRPRGILSDGVNVPVSGSPF